MATNESAPQIIASSDSTRLALRPALGLEIGNIGAQGQDVGDQRTASVTTFALDAVGRIEFRLLSHLSALG